MISLFKYFVIVNILFSLVSNKVLTNSKKISFIHKFNENSENLAKISILDKYNRFLDKYTKENLLEFKYAKINNLIVLQPFLKFKQEIAPGKDLKLFSIENEYVISLQNIKKNDYYEAFYSKIKDEENVLALFLLSEINIWEKSDFINYIKTLPINKTPLLYEFYSLNLFRQDETFSNVIDQINKYKNSYNDMRRLVFSHGEQIKEEFIGSFLLGDYLWAVNFVKSHSIKLADSLYLIPGTENLKLYGLENLQDDKINCCLKYKIEIKEKYTDVYLNFNSENYYEFYDKYENKVSKILANPMYNNENLYLKYGLIFDIEQENIYDFYNLNVKDIQDKITFKKIRSDDEKTFNSTILKISCSQFDLRNFDYFLKIYSEEGENYQRNFKNIISYFSEKIFIIDSLFEQGYESEVIEEVREAFMFLTNKKNFFLKLIDCLQTTFSKNLNEDNKEKIENHDNLKINIKEEF